jgi:DNA repair exonuclease SbcCD ATPase subunit
MNKLPSVYACAAAALIGLVAGSAWCAEATTNTSATTAGPVRNPPPERGGYARGWQPPSPWPAPPPGFGPLPPYPAPFGHYRAAAAAPAEPPSGTELAQTREQLKSTVAELETAHATLAQLRLRLQDGQAAAQAREDEIAALTRALQAASQALQQAQSGNTLSSQQLGAAMAQADTLKNQLTGLNVQLENQKTLLLNARQNAMAEHAGLTDRTDRAATPPSQEAVPDAARDTGQTLAVLVTERDGLLADLAAVVAERDALQDDLATCRRSLDRAREALSAR